MSKERLNYIFCLLLISVAALDFQRGPDTAAAFWGIAAITATVLTVSKSVERILEEQEGNTANFPGIYHLATRKKRENAAMLFLEFKSIHRATRSRTTRHRKTLSVGAGTLIRTCTASGYLEAHTAGSNRKTRSLQI